MRNTLTTQADSVQMAVKEFLSVPEENGVHDLEHFDLHVWPQMWSNTSGGWEGVGGATTTMMTTVCIVRGNRCCVYFDGRFAYQGDMRDEWFSKGFRERRVLGALTFARTQAQIRAATVAGG